MPPRPENIDFSNVAVLVVDDNQYMRELMGHMLRAFQVGTVLHAVNAKDAFEELRRTDIDCIIVDWLMPVMSGLNFVLMLRTSPQSPKPDIPIIMCTGHTEKERVEDARDAGVSELLTKPVSPRALLFKLDAAINHPRPFIVSPKYTGPCRRRRHKAKYDGIERRHSIGLRQDDVDALLKS